MVPTRRAVLATLLAAPGLASSGLRRAVAASARELDLTPQCIGHAEPTVAETEGPYFKPNAPLRRALAPGRPQAERIRAPGPLLCTAATPAPAAPLRPRLAADN